MTWPPKIRYDSEAREYPLRVRTDELQGVMDLAFAIYEGFNKAKESAEETHEVMHSGIKDLRKCRMGSYGEKYDIDTHSHFGLFLALSSGNGLLFETEGLKSKEEVERNPNRGDAYNHNLAEIISKEGQLVLKIHEWPNIGINPEFLKQIGEKFGTKQPAGH